MPPSASIGQKQKKSAENTRKGVYFVNRVVAAVLCGLVLTIGFVAQAVEPRAAGYTLEEALGGET